MSGIHHIALKVSSEKTKIFYDRVLAGLGFQSPTGNGVHIKGDTVILIVPADSGQVTANSALGLGHLAFAVNTRNEVDQFFNDVLSHLDGVRIEDPPGDFPEYGYEEYYATYFYDPDGNKMEVVYTKGRCPWGE